MGQEPLQYKKSNHNQAPGPKRGYFEATVAFNRSICREHFLLRLRLAEEFPATQAGQFVQLGCRPPASCIDTDRLCGQIHEWPPAQAAPPTGPELRGVLALLRRPFSIAGRGDDPNGTWIDIIHRVVGAGTAWMSGLRPGDPVDLIGPLGNCFSLVENQSIGLLVGGGVGLPPMFYLAQQMQQAGWDAGGFVGALSSDLLAVTFDKATPPDRAGAAVLCVEEYARYGFASVVTTDDGSVGLRGRITEGLEGFLRLQAPSDTAKTVVYTCGPEPMMHAVAKLARAHGVGCQVCLEQAMACGMGTCQSCVVKIEDSQNPHAITESGRPWRYRLACTDGPIFEASTVLW